MEKVAAEALHFYVRREAQARLGEHILGLETITKLVNMITSSDKK